MSATVFAIGEKMEIRSCNAYPLTLPADNLSKTHPGKEKAPAVVSPVCGE
jgi:hypothetical protein